METIMNVHVEKLSRYLNGVDISRIDRDTMNAIESMDEYIQNLEKRLEKVESTLAVNTIYGNFGGGPR